MEPSYFVEGWNPNSQDSKSRILQKINGYLYSIYGNKGPSYYPEGSKPQPFDSIKRTEQKILALKR